MKLFATLLSVAALVCVVSSVAAQQGPQVSGILAKHETEALSRGDKLAALQAEQGALESGQIVTGYEWHGPDGASGTIIVGTLVADFTVGGICRRFIHVVHHKNDGGRNPTFDGTVCRDTGGRWYARSDR